jgi:ferredoxin
MYINPNDCIDCSACIPECPVDAIVSSEDEAIQLGEYQSVIKNYEFFGLKYLENQ